MEIIFIPQSKIQAVLHKTPTKQSAKNAVDCGFILSYVIMESSAKSIILVCAQ